MPDLPDTARHQDPLSPYDGVMMLSYGGPNGPEDVLPFMRNATAGRGVPDERLLEVSGHYGRFGGVSPINARNAQILAALREELQRRGSRLPVLIGNRNWHPFVSETLREFSDAGARRILVLTTSAYGSYSGCRQYWEDLTAALALLAEGKDGETGQGMEADAAARVGGRGGQPVELVVDKTRPFYNTPGMLEANVDAIVEAMEAVSQRVADPAAMRLIFVTHSIPLSMETGSGTSSPHGTVSAENNGCCGVGNHSEGVLEPGMSADLGTEISYVAQHEAFIEALMPVLRARAAARGLPAEIPWDLAYCSRSGPPQARWLEPDINDHLEALMRGDIEGVRPPSGVIVAPIGFVADHMEVVFDLDTEARQTAEDLALPYERAATAGTHPAFIESLADILLERARVTRGEPVEPVSTTGTGPFHTVCPPSCCRPARSGHRSSHAERTQ